MAFAIWQMAHAARALTAVVLAAVLGCSAGATDQPTHTPLVHYEDVGTGSPIVFVHGFTQTHKSWQFIPIYDDLRPDHRLVSVDLRGHGDSPKPHDPRQYGKHMADDLVRVLDALDIERAHFIGFSMGASIVGELLVGHPQRVATATLGSGFFTRWDEGEEEFADFVLARGDKDERYPWEPANQDFAALAAVIRGARHAVVSTQQIEAITTPTLISFGSVELDAMPTAWRAQLASLPEAIRLMTIEGADHDSEKAAVLHPEFTRAARELIESNPI